MTETTIAAISTAYGEAGIGIVRMSGPDSLSVLQKVFVSPALSKRYDCHPEESLYKCNSEGRLSKCHPERRSDERTNQAVPYDIIPRHMYYGRIVDPKDGQVIDECLAVWMPGPYSYTGEDVAEIQCHGSVISYKRILSVLLENGAVLAEPGEFTKRAFLNGRMDLAQAEAVIDIIKARSSRSFETAVDQLSGGLSQKVKAVRALLLDVLVDLTVNMDYPDEDIEEVTYGKLSDDVTSIRSALLDLASSSKEGRIIREGLLVSIVGKPNVGKSSLMNMLLKEDRSIVTDIPGTTRDTIEEQISVRGISMRFVDTAGIREASDMIESIGIERSKDAFNKADLILLLLDPSQPVSEEDRQLIDMIQGRQAIVIINKTDAVSNIKEKLSAQGIAGDLLDSAVYISAKTGDGISDLEDRIENIVTGGRMRREEDVLVTNVRHANLIEKAIDELGEALRMIKAGEALDLIEINIRTAFDALGEITGETASGEVIDEVFSRFCLGK